MNVSKTDNLMSIFSTDQSHIKDVSCYVWMYIEDKEDVHIYEEQSLTILK